MFKRKHAHKDKIKFEIPIVRYLVYLLVVTLAVSGVSLSRYSVSSGTIESARVAKFDVSVIPDEPDIWTVDEITGGFSNVSILRADETSRAYSFTITNNSEVAIRARINKVTGEPLDRSYYSVADENDANIEVDSNGWFDFSPAGSGADTRDVTISLVSAGDTTNLTIFFEYQQID